MSNPWRIIRWTDAEYRVVRQVCFHETELKQILSLPFPDNAACREPIQEMTSFDPRSQFFRRRFYPAKVGDFFQEHINQGLRDCSVVAFDDSTGDYLYEYDMPGGRTFLRNSAGKPVSQKRISKRFLDLME